MGAVWLGARAHLLVTLSTMTYTLAAAPARMVSHPRPAAALRSE